MRTSLLILLSLIFIALLFGIRRRKRGKATPIFLEDGTSSKGWRDDGFTCIRMGDGSYKPGFIPKEEGEENKPDTPPTGQ